MILFFPDADTVRLALTSGLVPPDVTLAPAKVSADAHGRLYVEPAVALSKATGNVLNRLGVKGSKRHGGDAVRSVGSWVELVPLEKVPGTPDVAGGAAVLFELPSAADLPALVTEMLRLGNDRQGFRWFAAADDAAPGRVLLRVVGPPYYTLLRALDGPAGGVRAYLERAPRVWVELGWTHPLAAHIKVAEGQFALLSPPAEWRFLDDAPYRDVYDLAQFPLPAAPVEWAPAEPPANVTVPLRLTAGNAADTAELWVLRDDPVGQLDALVRDADERLTQRLMFAVATTDAGAVAVLRTRPSKLPPPALPLENATAYKPYWKLPNLFLPVGRRLHPTLRRDAVRRLLADDPDRVVWLLPTGATGFTPESVPDAAFRSLEDWVDYVVEREHAPLAAWVGATRFEFDTFVCPEGGPRPKPDKPAPEPRAKDDGPAAPPPKPDPKPKAARPKAKAAAEFVPPPPEAVAPNEWKLRAKKLEEQFLAADGPLDTPERAALWPELAEAYAGTGEAAADAAVCWLHALWAADAPAAWADDWARAELGSATIGEADLLPKLRANTPSIADARAVVAGFLAAGQPPAPAWLAKLLPDFQRFVQKHEGVLPVRATWLAATRLARLADGDALGLARARDRLLERLLTEGLRPERDLPSFLRYDGLRDAERLRAARAKALQLHDAARAWIGRESATAGRGDALPRNLPFIDLMFGFAFAQLGEGDTARRLAAAAERAMVRPVPERPDPTHPDKLIAAVADRVLYQGFRYRVDEALAGRPLGGQLPPAVRAEFDDVKRKAVKKSEAGQGSVHDLYGRAVYVIERMRMESRLLEPNEIPAAYATNSVYDNRFQTDIANLPKIVEPAKLASEVRRLYREGGEGRDLKDAQTRVVHQALSLAHRAGEAFALEVLGWVPGVLVPNAIRVGNPPTGEDVATIRGEVVERAIVLAAHFGRPDLVRAVTKRFAELIRVEPDGSRLWLVNAAGRRALRNLRKLGLRDEVDEFLVRLQDVVFQNGDLAALRAKYAGKKAPSWEDALVTLATLAAGWLTVGHRDRAVPVLDAIRADLLGPTGAAFPAKDYTRVAAAYVRALGNGPAEFGFDRIAELFTAVPAGRLTNTLTTGPFYSRFHLAVVEEVVFALVSDEFALGPTGRKWLDDDEFLVRSRVHADVRAERGRAGV